MVYFHVRITPKSDGQDRVKLDFSRKELEQRVLKPYREGRPMTISGQTTMMDDIERVKITTTDQPSVHHRSIAEQHRNTSDIIRFTPIEWEIIDMGDDVTDDFITGPPGSEVEERPAEVEAKDLRPPADTREVFVVHGRNLAARDALFEFLRAVDLHPLEWSEAVRFTGKPAPYIGDILDAAFSRAHAIVVLFTPDDEARLRKPLWSANEPPHETQLTGQARANVLFEAGMAMARSQDRTVLVELGNLRPFSDIGGRHTVRLDNSSQRRQELAQRLLAAGCPVNLDGTDWHSAGDFVAALASTVRDQHEAEVVDERESLNNGIATLSVEAKILLDKAAEDQDYMISRHLVFEGLVISVDDTTLNITGNTQSEAAWDNALNGLIARGLAEDGLGNRTAFALTRKGVEAAEHLKESRQPN